VRRGVWGGRQTSKTYIGKRWKNWRNNFNYEIGTNKSRIDLKTYFVEHCVPLVIDLIEGEFGVGFEAKFEKQKKRKRKKSVWKIIKVWIIIAIWVNDDISRYELKSMKMFIIAVMWIVVNPMITIISGQNVQTNKLGKNLDLCFGKRNLETNNYNLSS